MSHCRPGSVANEGEQRRDEKGGCDSVNSHANYLMATGATSAGLAADSLCFLPCSFGFGGSGMETTELPWS